MSRAADVQCVADVGAVLGEGPVWDPRDEALNWVDIKRLSIFRRDQAGGIQRWATPFRSARSRRAGMAASSPGTQRGFAVVDPAACTYQSFANPEPDRPGNRFNGGNLLLADCLCSTRVASASPIYRSKAEALFRMKSAKE